MVVMDFTEHAKYLAPAVSISDNIGGPEWKIYDFLIPFLPCNAIGLMFKFDIIGGRPRDTPEVYKLTPMLSAVS